ncbi:MAG TPA: SDR family oxidoreductase [Cyclobacteriaceae bacterium]|nr:SDR family oxidoreductase [Cyclobacteriaceae bacterium]
MNKPTILITGANGLLGQKLVERLIERGSFRILATGRGKCRLPQEWEGYTYTQLDITDQHRVREVFAIHQPVVVIHCASMTNVDQCETDRYACLKQNVEAVKYIVKACEKQGSHLIHLSTDFVFDGAGGPYSETDSANPINFYGLTKLESENIVKQSSIKWAIVRTTLVYGISYDMSRSNIVLWVKNALENGKELNLVTDQFRTPTLAEDLAEGCILIAERGANGVYNISGKDFITPYDMAIETAHFFHLDATKIKRSDSTNFSQTAKRPLKTGFIIDKAVKELGYAPHSFREGIKIMAQQKKYSLTV